MILSIALGILLGWFLIGLAQYAIYRWINRTPLHFNPSPAASIALAAAICVGLPMLLLLTASR